jgi:Tfp pilus assembly protein PilN
MKAPRIDFVRGTQSPGIAGYVLLGCGLLAVAYTLISYQDLTVRSANLQARLGAMAPSGERADAGLGRRNDDELRRQLQLAAQVVQRKTVPWDVLFRDIEEATDKNVGLLSIQPEPANRVLRIEGEARDLASLTAYIARLEERPSLRNVHLVTHELRNEAGQRSVRFGVNATWAAS